VGVGNRSGFQKKAMNYMNKQVNIRWIFVGITTLVLILTTVSIILTGVFGWRWFDWTGFGDYRDPSGNYQRAKTFWDWLELLIVPITLAIGAWLLNRTDKDHEYRLAQQPRTQLTPNSSPIG
jgi:uncharacterized membrane protein